MKKTIIAGALALLSMNAASAQQAGHPVVPTTLPGGATTLQESFEDWTVTCGVQDNKKLCAVSQQQAQQNGQRVLAIEVSEKEGAASATLILPFGILLPEGVTYQLDDKGKPQLAIIKSCFPGGCVSTIKLTPEMLNDMKTGTLFKIMAKTADSSQDFKLNVSLKGFGAAYNRLQNLVK